VAGKGAESFFGEQDVKYFFGGQKVPKFILWQRPAKKTRY
jgi:hypothetical protein